MTQSQSSVFTIDCHYLKPRFAAAYLIVEQGKATFVENNTSLALPYLLDALKSQSLTPESVDYIIVTHAHLDHAGGTSELLNHCKNAKVLAHPKAAKTLINPERLIESAKKVYGESEFHRLYGTIQPIPQEKIRSVLDGEQLNWGERIFTFFHTLGHATHHMCIYDSKTESVFTGDTFGLRYPDIQKSKVFILPSTSPIDYNPLEAKKSADRILSFHPKRLFLTHFGEVSDISKAYLALIENLDIHEKLYEWAKAHLDLGDDLAPQIENQLKTIYHPYEKDLELDLQLNAQGIAFSARNFSKPR